MKAQKKRGPSSSFFIPILPWQFEGSFVFWERMAAPWTEVQIIPTRILVTCNDGNCHLFWRNYFFFPTWPKTFYFSFFRKHDFTFSPRVFLENFLFFLLDNFDENLGNCSLASYMRRRRKILKSRWSHISKPRQQPPSRCRTARSRERVKRTQTE